MSERESSSEFKKLLKRFKGSDPAFVISCKKCGQRAVIVSFRPAEHRISVDEVSSLVSEPEFLRALKLISAGKFAMFETFLFGLRKKQNGYSPRSFEDGLKNFCRKCDAAYCEKHSSAWPVFEDGGSWYDYTEWRCPKGHTHMIDD